MKKLAIALWPAALFLWVLATATPFFGAEVHHHPGESEVVDRFYSSWMRPKGRSASCCNKTDCYATRVKNEGGTWFALRREDQVWWPIPHGIIEQNQADPRESPDGLSHVCMTSPAESCDESGECTKSDKPAYSSVFCFTLGDGT